MKREVSTLLEHLATMKKRTREAINYTLHMIDKQIMDKSFIVQERLLLLLHAYLNSELSLSSGKDLRVQ